MLALWALPNVLLILAAVGTVTHLMKDNGREQEARKRSPNPKWTQHWLFWLAVWSFATTNSTLFAITFRSRSFNDSLWDTLFVLGPLGAGVFLVAFRSIVHAKEGYYYFFDPKHSNSQILQREGGEFGPHSKRYRDLAKLIVALSGGVIAFLVNTLANAGKPTTEIVRAIRITAPIVVGFFGFAIAFLVLFMALQAYWYEEYCSCEKHDSYNRWKYAICVTLGWTGLFSFGVGVFWLAANLF